MESSPGVPAWSGRPCWGEGAPTCCGDGDVIFFKLCLNLIGLHITTRISWFSGPTNGEKVCGCFSFSSVPRCNLNFSYSNMWHIVWCDSVFKMNKYPRLSCQHVSCSDSLSHRETLVSRREDRGSSLLRQSDAVFPHWHQELFLCGPSYSELLHFPASLQLLLNGGWDFVPASCELILSPKRLVGKKKEKHQSLLLGSCSLDGVAPLWNHIVSQLLL